MPRTRETGRQTVRATLRALNATVLVVFLCSIGLTEASEPALKLRELIDEALRKNHEVLMMEARLAAAGYRIPQSSSLPDPMLMIGYQNEGFRRYNYGESPDAQWMFSASQMFPFPGKLSAKETMARSDAEGQKEMLEAARRKTVSRVKELYYDLFLAHKGIQLLQDLTGLFLRVEESALARYASGKGMQQEVLMAQTEKYMLREREEMLRQKVQSFEAMLNSAVGRDAASPLGVPPPPSFTTFGYNMDELMKAAVESSPEVHAKERMIAAAEAKVEMARKEYYPDFTVSASYAKRGGEFMDMWSLSTSLNIPIFYRTKQRQALAEARASLEEAIHDFEAMRLMLAAAVRDNYAMLQASERLMTLYREGLIPKTYQDFEAALAGYTTGGIEAITVISRLKALVDFENLAWTQFVEREKAVARIEAITGLGGSGK